MKLSKVGIAHCVVVWQNYRYFNRLCYEFRDGAWKDGAKIGCCCFSCVRGNVQKMIKNSELRYRYSSTSTLARVLPVVLSYW